MPYSLRYPDLALHLQISNLPSTQWVSEEITVEPLEDVEAVYIYGLGRCGQPLWKWLEKNPRHQLIFLENDLAALAAFAPEAEKLLSHPQVHLKWALSSHILEECAAQFSYEHIQVIATSAKAKYPAFRKIQESLLRRTLLWHSVTSEEISGHLLHRNIIANLHRLPQCSYVNAWEGAWKGVPAIICGAGPSLEASAEALRQVQDQKQDRALIIACGSALSALSHLNIRPHLGVAIDPNAREFDCLKGCSYRDLPLLFASRLYPKVFEIFEGRYGYIRCGSGGSLENHVEHELGLKDPFLGQDLGREALSVTTLAVSLARHWGCNPIIFAGVDLAYTRQTHYSKGVLAEQIPMTGLLRRLDVSGKFVKTTLKWIMERDTFDAYAKHHPEVTFLNTSQGLKFSHIPSTSLKEALSGYSSNDLTGRLNRLMDKKTDINAQQVSELFRTIKMSVERCLTLLLTLQQEEKGSGKAILYESDLEAELAYRLLLEPPRLSLERLGRPEVWGPLEEIARSYL